MLGKLLKYEVKATARIFLPFYVALIAMAFVNKMFFLINGRTHAVRLMESYSSELLLSKLTAIPSNLAMMGFIGIIIAVFAITVFVMIQRFYKNLLGDEGYLMFTLPVKPWHNIVSKLAVSTMWVVASFAVTALAIAITVMDGETLSDLVYQLESLDREARNNVGISLLGLITELIICGIGVLVTSILQVYVSIALGQLFNSHKLLASCGAYFVIKVILQAITSISIIVFASMFNDFSTFSEMASAFQIVIAGSLLINIACAVVFYIGTNWLLSKKLNLE